MEAKAIYQNDYVVSSWEELCEEVYHDAWKPGMGRYRSDYAFRGLSDSSYELKNSFLRNCGSRPELEYVITSYSIHYTKLYEFAPEETTKVGVLHET